MSDFQFFDIILLAMVAGFIALRLRSVLGRRMGHHQQPPDVTAEKPGRSGEPGDDNVIPLPDNTRRKAEVRMAADDSPLGAALTQIKLADRSFEPASFLDGAKGAYEMIVTAFAQGDRDTLKTFLSDDVYRSFERAIADREAQNYSHETTLVAMKESEIIDAELKDSSAEITVKFVSDLVNVTRDSDGRVVDGDPNQIDTITDIWTFARDTQSRDPNWTLVATRVPS
jgi:predicted lipid-binding transport protein (Tim44 family)